MPPTPPCTASRTCAGGDDGGAAPSRPLMPPTPRRRAACTEGCMVTSRCTTRRGRLGEGDSESAPSAGDMPTRHRAAGARKPAAAGSGLMAAATFADGVECISRFGGGAAPAVPPNRCNRKMPRRRCADASTCLAQPLGPPAVRSAGQKLDAQANCPFIVRRCAGRTQRVTRARCYANRICSVRHTR